MKRLPELNQDFKSLNNLFFESIRKNLMMTSLELRIFNLLSKPSTAEEITKSLNTNSQNTEYFLDALTAENFVTKNEGIYLNNNQTQTFLVEGSPTYLGDFFKVQETLKKPVMTNMAELVKSGTPELNKTYDSKKSAAEMIERCANLQRAGMAQQIAKFVSSLPEFPGFKKMLDIGGGSGLICTAIISEHPFMKEIILDFPLILDVANKFIDEYEMNERISTHAGKLLQRFNWKGI